jgi:hypothetical protein
MEPINKELYDKVKKEIFKIYKTNSAYRSGAIIKRYKELGGEFKPNKKTNEGLTRWFKEKWQDIGGEKYPVYRPTRKISAKTPLLPSEIDPKNLKQQIKLKQKIKSNVLPAFKKKTVK